ncbi:MAG: glycosyltransferase [Bacteroidota bacterium]
MKITVILCTYNPNRSSFAEVISSLKSQTLPFNLWEFIIIDNNSDYPLLEWIDVSWHPNTSVVLEKQSGLSFARLKGVSLAAGELIVFVDDDNLLEEKYLEKSLAFYNNNPSVGSFGGKSLPIFETPPPDWFFETGINLGCQDLGNTPYISNYSATDFKLKEYPQFAPIGTGMVIQKQAFLTYSKEVTNSEARLALGRKGKSLTSGEDNDIILTIVKHGYEIAYLPGLVVKHLIPKNRFSFDYLKKMAYESNRSWIKVLHFHGLNPWKPIPNFSLKLREIKAYVKEKAWKSKLNYVNWNGVRGKLKGLSEI